MVRSKTHRGWCAGALLFLAADARAAGEEAASRFRLAFEAPAGCPDRAAFVRGIRARTPRPQLVDDESEPAIALRVVIVGGSDRASGTLHLREPDGTEETRSVTGRTCAEVGDALALVAAVMLDPEARTEAEPPVSMPESAPPSAPSPVPPIVPAPPPSVPRRPPVSRLPSPSRPRMRWLVSGGAELGMLGGIGPAVAPMFGAFAEVERRAPALASTARVSVDVASTSSALRSGWQTYEWFAATIRGCPAYVSLSKELRLAPCAALQIGGHRGTTRDVRSPTTNVDLWLAPVAVGAVEWQASSIVSVEAQGGALFPLRQTRFYLAPSSTIFEVPAVAGTASLALRVRFR